VKDHTWEELKAVKLEENSPYRLFYQIIIEAVGIRKRILDVGAGDCCMTCCIVGDTESTALAVDLVDDPRLNFNAEEMIKLAGLKDRVKFLPGINVTFPSPFGGETFDVSLALGVLEHVWCPGHHNIIENMIKASREKCIFLIPDLGNKWAADPYTEGAGHINLFDIHRIKRCFNHYPYSFEVYRNYVGMGCWLVIMNLKKRRRGPNKDEVEIKEIW